MGRKKKVVEDKVEVVLTQPAPKEEYNPDTDPDLKMTPSRVFENNYASFKVKYKLPKTESLLETIYIANDKYILTRYNDNYFLYSVNEKNEITKINKAPNPVNLREKYIEPLLKEWSKKKKKTS